MPGTRTTGTAWKQILYGIERIFIQCGF
jgi:hypothetical protein